VSGRRRPARCPDRRSLCEYRIVLYGSERTNMMNHPAVEEFDSQFCSLAFGPRLPSASATIAARGRLDGHVCSCSSLYYLVKYGEICHARACLVNSSHTWSGWSRSARTFQLTTLPLNKKYRSSSLNSRRNRNNPTAAGSSRRLPLSERSIEQRHTPSSPPRCLFAFTTGRRRWRVIPSASRVTYINMNWR
jgi:hypothetical protein